MTPTISIHSLLLWLVTFFVLLDHAASINPRLLNTTSSTTAPSSNYSTSTTSPRQRFDSIVSSWKQKNPDLGHQIADETLDNVWQHLSGNGTPTPPSTKNARNIDNPVRKQSQPLYKRQNVTSTLTAARSIVADAMVQQAKINNNTLSNPRLNVYTKKPSGSAARRELSSLSSLLTATNSSLANALPLVAEADAAVLAQQGKLYKNYATLTGKYAKYNLPGTPSGSQHNKRDSSWWLPVAADSYPGSLPFGGNTSEIWRNVLYYGAYGDGVHDDTAAINYALNDGCENGCGSSTTRGAVVYFPPGTYLVSSPIIASYNTQLVGNPNSLPVIMAAPSFAGLGVITSDVYIPNGNSATWYLDTDNFFRQIRNFVIDLAECTTSGVAGIHWQVAQVSLNILMTVADTLIVATSLQNIEIVMTTGSASTQVGIFSENGSGGFMSDILVYGGNIGMQCGNQQFTSRNMIFALSTTGISMLWDWGWTFKSITFDSVQHAIWMQTTTVGGSIHLLDSTMNGVTTNGIVMDNSVGSTQQEQVLITIDNLVVDSSTIVVFDLNAGTFLETSGAQTIQSWAIGKQYDADNPDGSWVNGDSLDTLHPVTGNLMGGPNGGYFERSKQQYNDFESSNVLLAGWFAAGDGKTDDTAGLSLAFELGAAYNEIVFIPTGSYIISSTVLIPVNSKVVGSLWSQLVASGKNFEDMENPEVMIQVGNNGDLGTVELQDLLFTATGATAGVILLEWNVAESSQGAAAMWDCHFRVGGATGTQLQVAQCPTSLISNACIGASLMFHVTSSGNGYFENVWAWSADHDMDDPNETQINVFTGRGTLIESSGPCWFYASASEHSVLYQYNLANAEDIFMGMIQTESPYYAPIASAPTPFTPPQAPVFTDDPDFSFCKNISCESAWALTITESTNIQILGAGLYSWYNDDYSEACVDTQNCQLTLVNVQESGSIYLYNLYTIGSVDMITPGGLNQGLSDIVTAKANQVENSHPFLSALNAWISIDTNWVGTGHEVGSDPSDLCSIGPGTDHNAVIAAESRARHIAAFFESYIEANGAVSLATNLWKNAPQEYSANEIRCDQLTGDTCPEPFDCDTVWTDADAVPRYWASSTLYVWFETMQFWATVFDNALINTTTIANSLISDFPVQMPVVPAASTILGDFGAVLSILGAAVTVNPAFEAGGTAGAVLSTIGGIVSTIGTAVSPSDSTPTTPAEALATHINQVFGNAIAGIQSLMNGVADNGDLSQVSTQYTTGAYSEPIANYFDNGSFLYLLSGDQESAIKDNVTTYLQANLVGFLLEADNWWILQDAYTQADCPGISSGTWLNGHCYTLESFGTGYTSSSGLGGRHTMWSVPVSNSTLTSIESYNINLTDLYSSSVNCQAGHSYYGGSVTLGYSEIVDAGLSIPTCFYSLPVFYVSPSEDDLTNGAFADNPCIIYENNKTATTPVAGETFFPDNIASYLSAHSDYCCIAESKEVVCANDL